MSLRALKFSCLWPFLWHTFTGFVKRMSKHSVLEDGVETLTRSDSGSVPVCKSCVFLEEVLLRAHPYYSGE